MFKKILLIFLIPHFFYGCGYSPLYSNSNNKNVNIRILEIQGDQEINNFLIAGLKKNTGNEGKTYLLDIDTNYSILENSKNLVGSITSYELIAVTRFTIKNDDLNKIITIQEDIVMKNLSDNFEKRNYEKSIKKNFGRSISNKLILQLSAIQ